MPAAVRRPVDLRIDVLEFESPCSHGLRERITQAIEHPIARMNVTIDIACHRGAAEAGGRTVRKKQQS
jgi:hypothetical protein